MSKYLLVGFAFFFSLPEGLAQEKSVPLFVGLNPSVTVEPFYAKGEFDVGIFPLVIQRPLGLRWDVRASTILNLGVRNNGNGISHYGLELAFPFFFSAKPDRFTNSNGFYASPILSLTQNRMADHTNTGTWLEAGYFFPVTMKWGISVGLQAGVTHFNYSTEEPDWKSHFGVKAIVGRWFTP
jgi:hypothetical protein